MENLKYVIYIASIVLVILLGLFIYVVSMILSFKSKLEKREVAFSVLFSEKQEILLTIFGMFDAHKEDFKSSLVDLTTQVRWIKFDKLKNEDIDKIAFMLNDLEKALARMGHKYKEFDKNKDYTICWNTIADINSNYRRNVANYDSEIEGYEYWRRFLIFRPILAILPFKKMNRVH